MHRLPRSAVTTTLAHDHTREQAHIAVIDGIYRSLAG